MKVAQKFMRCYFCGLNHFRQGADMPPRQTAPLPIRTREINTDLEKEFRNRGLNMILSRILASREISGVDEVLSKKTLLPWKDLKDAGKAAEILADSIVAGKRIVVVADYDSDGATSCALAVSAMASFGAKVDFAVPNRFVHGYGLTRAVAELVIKEKAPDVIVTVDNGVSSHDGVAYAKNHGVSVVITDHHIPPPKMPDADAIVNPNQPDCGFPSKNMAGVGVVFYVMAALREKLKSIGALPEGACHPQDLLDLVSIGTVADVVKLDANNRLMVRMGLDRIRKGRTRPGVAALFTAARRSMDRATSKDMGFAIGPRINAAGRLADMAVGIRCLLSDDFQEALDLALQLDDLNTSRKNIEGEMQEEALAKVWKEGGLGTAGSITVFDESFHEGVIGIVAGRIKELEHRPTIVFAPAQEEGLVKGSARSIPGFHMRDALERVSTESPGLIHKFGGHAMAAGLTIGKDSFDKFRAAFEKVAKETLTEDMLSRFVSVDGDLPGDWISLSLAEALAGEVWGQGFPEPLFCSEFVVREQRLIKSSHLKLSLEKDGEVFDAIWFFRDKEFSSGRIEAVYSLEPSEYRGETFPQLMLVQASEIG